MDTVNRLLSDLKDYFTSHPTLNEEEVASILQKFSQETKDFEPYIKFNPHRYNRILVASNKYFSLLINCWQPKQSTPMHNHGDTTTNWISVLEGELRVDIENDKEIQIEEHAKPVVLHECDHVTGNFGEKNCVSLHLFSPPYVECCFKENKGLRTSLNSIPAIHTEFHPKNLREIEENETLALLKSRPIYANFNKLVSVLREEIQFDEKGRHSKENVDHVSNILACFKLNPQEWAQYARFAENRYTRNLIGYDEKFTLLLLCWEKGQKSPIHDHAGSNCWVKVLEGSVEETIYALQPDGVNVEQRSTSRFFPGEVTYIHDNIGLHKMGNASSSEVAMSLHVYSPAYHQCHVFSEVVPEKRKVSISTAYGAIYPFMERKIVETTSDCYDLKTFLCQLKCALTHQNFDKVNSLVDSLRFSPEQWNQYIHFNPDQYVRNLIGFNEHCSVMLVCWAPNQQTPVHDHGNDKTRQAWVKVLHGHLTFEHYAEKDGVISRLENKSDINLLDGEYAVLPDSELGLHVTKNGSTSENCISLHIYTPPYVECSFKKKCGQTQLIPVAYCSKETNGISEEQEASLQLQYQFRTMVFSNFAALSNLVSRHYESKVDDSELPKILAHLRFHEEEWRRGVSDSFDENFSVNRNLVGYGYQFSIYLYCWKPHSESPIHDHNQSNCYFAVLDGSLQYTTYTNTEASLLEEKSISIFEHQAFAQPPSQIHKLANLTDKPVYSLHIFSPALEECTAYGSDGFGSRKLLCDYHFVDKQ